MAVNRRQYLAGLAALPIAAAATRAVPAMASEGKSFPAKAQFAMTNLAYLDNGSQHPISLGARAAIEGYLSKRMLDPTAQNYDLDEEGVLAKFARLINADVDEVTFVQSTTAGEQIIVRALDLPAEGGHVVTDTLHFFGSIPLYEELEKKGVKVTWVRPVEGRILLADIKKALERGATLVALSQVSTINGFEHDLKAVCDLAHSKGALVYADIIHAAGAVPVDVKATGVDFAACASYKWLMGDFGLGFLYVRKDVRPRLKRVNFGYYGLKKFTTHIYPLDTLGEHVADYSFTDDATGSFALGTYCHTVIAQLHHSLDWIENVGVLAIQAHAQELVMRLKDELPKRGYPLMTPAETRTPLVTAIMPGAREKLAAPMAAAGVKLTTSTNRFRLSPSVYNDHGDLDRFFAALPKA